MEFLHWLLDLFWAAVVTTNTQGGTFMQWIGIVLKMIAEYYFRRMREVQERIIRLKMSEFYVKALIIARKSTIGLIGLYFVLNFVLMGIVLLVGGLFYFLPWDTNQKVIVLMILGGTFVILPLVLFVYLLSEKTWYKAAGIDKILEDFAPDTAELKQQSST